MDCDLLVIGSGFGGSVAALRGAEAGMRVIVLERGPALDEAAWTAMAQGRWPLIHREGGRGIIDVHARRGIACVTGSAVGGGSHVYTSVTMPMPDEVLAHDWPAGLDAQAAKLGVQL